MKKNLRRCPQCRILNHRQLMLEVRRTLDGQLSLDKSLGGRGLYLCANVQCIERACKNKSISRLLGNVPMVVWQDFCGDVLGCL